MENKEYILDPLFERAENYAKSSIELFKLKTANKSAQVISTLYLRGIIIFLFAIFIITVSIGASLWLGEILGKSYYGFFCVGGFYLLFGMIVSSLAGKYIKRRVRNSVISQILN